MCSSIMVPFNVKDWLCLIDSGVWRTPALACCFFYHEHSDVQLNHGLF